MVGPKQGGHRLTRRGKRRSAASGGYSKPPSRQHPVWRIRMSVSQARGGTGSLTVSLMTFPMNTGLPAQVKPPSMTAPSPFSSLSRERSLHFCSYYFLHIIFQTLVSSLQTVQAVHPCGDNIFHSCPALQSVPFLHLLM